MKFKKKRAGIILQEDFGQLFQEFAQNEKGEGQMVQGSITGVEKDYVVVDIGMKSEGRIPISEFTDDDGRQMRAQDIVMESKVDVFIERFEGRNGFMVLSRERALKDAAWKKFESLYSQNAQIDGKIIGRVKGGFAVELRGIIAFLPGSQVDIRPIRDISSLMGVEQQFKILKMDGAQGNVVVSRRAILEESRKEARDELLSNISEGMILEGMVKNITDYGVFVDLKSTDGLLHITDISWSKITHPSEVLSIGQVVKVMVIKYNPESQRISLGLKQLTANPWEEFREKYKAGTEVHGKVTTIADYGAFVELQSGVEGLVYHTEIDWLAKNIHPRKLLNVGDEVDVVVLDIDVVKHRISLSIKRRKPNPWEEFVATHPVGTRLKCVIRNIADFGIFIVPEEGADSELAIIMLIPAVELSWDEPFSVAIGNYTKGQVVDCVIISTDAERERIGASIRQLVSDPLETMSKNLIERGTIKAKIVAVRPGSLDIELERGVMGNIPVSELSSHKTEQRTDLYKEGDEIEVKVIGIDPYRRIIEASKKALEAAEASEVVEASEAACDQCGNGEKVDDGVAQLVCEGDGGESGCSSV